MLTINEIKLHKYRVINFEYRAVINYPVIKNLAINHRQTSQIHKYLVINAQISSTQKYTNT